MKKNTLNIIEMYIATEQVRQYIDLFNMWYVEQNTWLSVDSLITGLQEMYQLAMGDTAYWKEGEIDFHILQEQTKEIKRAEMEKDFAVIYDKLNYQLWKIVKDVLEMLFYKNAKMLRDFFWMENSIALNSRFPEILEKLKIINAEGQNACIRPYGTRGNVVYRRNGSMEFDLYSAYNTIGMRIEKRINHKNYKKIYIWGCNGGCEINEIVLMNRQKDIDIEINVTDLVEFNRILLNTQRKGVLLNPKIQWKFNRREEEFIKDFDMIQKNTSYIFLCEYGNRNTVLEKFIYKNSLNSNMREL